MKYRKTFVAAAMSAVMIGSGAVAQEHELLLGYSVLKGTTYQDVAEGIQERILKATDGKVLITGNASLLSGVQLAPGVRDGQIDMALIVPPYYAATQPILAVPALPGLIRSVDEYRTLMDGYLGDETAAMWDKEYNSLSLMNPPFCEQTLMSTVEVPSVADFRGLKIRVHNPATGRLIAQVGAQPTPLPAAEVLPGLQQKVIDGVFTAECWALGSGFPSVVKYTTQWNAATYLPWTLLVSKDSWEKLPEDIRATLAEEFAAWENEIYEEYPARSEADRAKWEELGIPYRIASPEEVAELQSEENVTPVFDAWYDAASEAGLDGQAIIQTAREILGQ